MRQSVAAAYKMTLVGCKKRLTAGGPVKFNDFAIRDV